MRVLITGAAGFLGHGVVTAFADHHDLKLFDVVPAEGPGEIIVGSVTDLEQVREATRDVDALVIGHMAPRGKGYYQTPAIPFEVNVTGTVNLYTAAVEHGIKKVALISSIGAVNAHRQAGTFLSVDLPLQCGGTHPYGLTKVCQEVIAQQYYLNEGIGTGILRPAYICDAEGKTDKYGRQASEANWQYIDRRDIGKAARLAVELDDLQCEAFYVLGHPGAAEHADMARTRDRLGWTPDYDFTNFAQASS